MNFGYSPWVGAADMGSALADTLGKILLTIPQQKISNARDAYDMQRQQRLDLQSADSARANQQYMAKQMQHMDTLDMLDKAKAANIPIAEQNKFTIQQNRLTEAQRANAAMASTIAQRDAYRKALLDLQKQKLDQDHWNFHQDPITGMMSKVNSKTGAVVPLPSATPQHKMNLGEAGPAAIVPPQGGGFMAGLEQMLAPILSKITGAAGFAQPPQQATPALPGGMPKREMRTGQPTPNGMIRMRSPDGKTGKVPADQLQQAIQEGFTPHQ